MKVSGLETNIFVNLINSQGSLLIGGSSLVLHKDYSSINGETRLGSGVLVVQGDFIQSGAQSLTMVEGGNLTVNGVQLNSGLFYIGGGTIDLLNGTFFNVAGSVFGGGTILGDFVNGGSVYIGGSYGIGNLQISGSFTQGQFGILHVRIGASGNHDILQVQADLALDGTVRVEILSGFQIGSFGFIEYSGNRNGTSFALIDPIGDAASYLWALDYGQNGIVNLVSQ